MAHVEVRQLLEADDRAGLDLRGVVGLEGLGHRIEVPRIQKPGLALAGYAEQLHRQRVLVFGGTEIEYMLGLDSAALHLAVKTVMASDPACVVLTRGLTPLAELEAACVAEGVPLLVTPRDSATFIKKVTNWLDVQLGETTTVHGVMVDVLEVGILLLGRSGVGKSEAALDLVERGHRLVADDVVGIQSRADGTLVASGSIELGHHMEIRGLGIINIADLFGITAIRDSKRLDLVVELSEWREGATYDRLGIEERTYELLDTQVPFVVVPVKPGRNIASIIEVAARNQLLKDVGHYSAQELLKRLDEQRVKARAQVSE